MTSKEIREEYQMVNDLPQVEVCGVCDGMGFMLNVMEVKYEECEECLGHGLIYE